MEHMVRRGATYHYRRRIPTDLVDALDGKREVTFSLKTKDQREAAARARRESVRLDDEWAAIRRTRALGPVPTDHDLVEVLGKIMVVPPPKGGWPTPEPMTAEEFAQWEAEEHAHQLDAEEYERHEEAARGISTEWLLARGFVRVAEPEDAKKGEPPTPQPKAVTLESLILHWQRECKPSTKAVQAATRTFIEFDNLHKDPSVQSISPTPHDAT